MQNENCSVKFRKYVTGQVVPTFLGIVLAIFILSGTAFAQVGPEIEIQSNGQVLVDGDTTPSIIDGTDYGSVGVPNLVEHSFFLINTGTSQLVFSDPTLSGSGATSFALSTPPPTNSLAPGAQTTFGIRFRPTSNGLREASVRIANNDADENPFTFDIQGTGTAIPTNFTIVSGNNQSAVINTAFADPLVFQVTDAGNTPIAGVTVNFNTPNAGASAAVSQSTTSTDANGEVSVTAMANNTLGAYQIAAEVPGVSTTNFDMTNIAADNIAPRVASVTRQSPMVRNTSDDTLTWRVTFDEPVQNVNGGFGGDFYAAGVIGGTVTSNAVSASVYDVTISAGTLATLNNTVTFFFNGAHDITDIAGNALTNLTPTGANDNDFNVSNTGPGAPEITMLGNFTDIMSGDTTPQVADNTDFGSHEVSGGQQVNSFTVFNDGNAQLNLNTGGLPVLISGAHAGDFSVDMQPTQFNSAGASSNFSIRFNPTDIGLRSATVIIHNNDPDENPFTFAIQGTGTDTVAPRIASIDTLFVSSPTDNDEVIWRILFNETVLNLTLDDFAISGTTAPLSIRTPATDNPGFGTLIDLRAIGGDLAELNGTITLSLAGAQNITDVSGNALVNPAPTGLDNRVVQIINVDPDIRVNGDGPIGNPVGPELVSGQTATSVADGTDFGNHVVGEFSTRFNYSVSNTIQFSTLVADVSQAIMSGPAAADFTVTGSNNLRLRGLSRSGFTVMFSPSALGARNATITIVSNDPDENPFTFNITGTGIAGPAANLAASAGTPQTQLVNTAFTDALVVTVTDAGGNPVSGVTVNFAAPGAGASATLSSASEITDASGEASITATANLVAGTYNVTASSAGLTNVNFALTNDAGAPEIDVTGNGQNIVSGDTTPTVVDNTDFGSHGVAGGQQANIFVVSNTGTGITTLSFDPSGPNVALSGAHAGDFTVSEPLADGIGAGTLDAFTITFNPTDIGLRSATVTIANNDADEDPFTFAVQGTGLDDTAPRIASILRHNPSLQFTDADTLTWRITFDEAVQNVGNTDFTASGVSGSVFTVVQNTTLQYDVTLSGGDLAGLNDMVTLSFAGGQDIGDLAGNALANVTPTGTNQDTYNVANASTSAIRVQRGATVITNGSTDTVPSQAAIAHTVIYDITNLGGVDLFIGPNASNLNNVSSLSIVSTGPNPTPPGQTRTLTATFNVNGDDDGAWDFDLDLSAASGTFIAFKVAGNLSGEAELIVRDSANVVDIANGDTTPVAADGTDFGNVIVSAIGAEAYSVIAGGNILVNISSVTLTGADAGEFSITNVPSSGINSAFPETINVDFNPTSLGTKSANLNIVSNDPNDSPFTFTIQGEGVAGAPSALSATSGGGQSQAVNTVFTNPVVATVTDAGGNPVSGVTVNFAAPGSGASASLSAATAITDGNGQASVTATANSKLGAYNVTASFAGITDVTFALTNTAGAPANLAVTAGSPQSQTVGLAFADPLVVTITDGIGNPVSGVNVGFSAPVSGASATLSAATATTDVSGQVSVTATANNTAGSYNVTASVAGLTNGTFALTNISADTTPPTISFAGVPAATDGSTVFPISGSFSETVNGFTISDISVSNGAASDLSVNGLNFTANITPDGNGDVNVSFAANVVQDTAGNGNTASAAQTSTLDNAAPTLSITLPNGVATGTISTTFTFSEVVNGFVLADIAVTGGTAANLMATGNTGTIFTADITPDAGTQGNVTISVAASKYTDSVGNLNTSASSATLSVDNQAPGVSLSNVAAEVIAAFSVTATFAEDVNGFTASDITIINGAISDFTAIDGSNYRFTITPAQLGQVTVDVAANVAVDAAGNGNTALASPLTTLFTIDKEAIRIRTQAVVYNFMAQRADQLTAGEPDLSKRLSPTSTQGRLNGIAEIGNVKLAFNGTASGEDLNLARALGANKAAKISTWLQASLGAIDHDDGSDADLFLLHGGVDYHLSKDVVLGIMAQYDYSNMERIATPSDDGFEVSGKGWLIGPYVVARLKDSLVFDGRIAWGQSDNEVSPSRTYTDKFKTNRWLMKGQLSGEMGDLAGWTVTPELALIYFTDKQSAFTDSNNININAQTVDLGRMSFGPRFNRSIAASNGLTLNPEVSVRGIWDFETPGTMDLLSGTITANDRFHARSQAGLRMDFSNGTSFGFQGFYDGIGAKNFNAYGASLQFDVIY